MAQTRNSGEEIKHKIESPSNAESVRIRVDTNDGGTTFVSQFGEGSYHNHTRKDAGDSDKNGSVLPRIENATPGGTTKGYDPKQLSGEIKLDKIDPEHVEKPPTPNIKTLADLIHVCRDRGFQIFNDKRNIPESDKLKVLPAYLSNPKVHSSDGVDAKGRGGSGSGRRSRRPSSYRQSESLESQNRMYSGWTTRSFKSRSDSRLERSSVNSIPSHVPSEYSINTDHSSGHQTVYTNVSVSNHVFVFFLCSQKNCVLHVNDIFYNMSRMQKGHYKESQEAQNKRLQPSKSVSRTHCQFS